MPNKQRLSHLDESGRARMVDVGDKPATDRVAAAEGLVVMSPESLKRVVAGDLAKGDVRGVAELAGVMAAKRTADLIPLCHPLPLTHVSVQVEFDHEASAVRVESRVRTTGPTGVEMEALTAVAVACLTVYDMVKGLDRNCRIREVRLVEKRGGSSGHFILDDESNEG